MPPMFGEGRSTFTCILRISEFQNWTQIARTLTLGREDRSVNLNTQNVSLVFRAAKNGQTSLTARRPVIGLSKPSTP